MNIQSPLPPESVSILQGDLLQKSLGAAEQSGYAVPYVLVVAIQLSLASNPTQ
jgi:hypothetical protein